MNLVFSCSRLVQNFCLCCKASPTLQSEDPDLVDAFSVTAEFSNLNQDFLWMKNTLLDWVLTVPKCLYCIVQMNWNQYDAWKQGCTIQGFSPISASIWTFRFSWCFLVCLPNSAARIKIPCVWVTEHTNNILSNLLYQKCFCHIMQINWN